MNYEKEIQFEPAYDKRSKDPKKNYGIHGVNMRWILKNEKGAVQFVIYTNWHLPEVTEELLKNQGSYNGYYHPLKPMVADLGYHSPKPIYEGQTMIQENCPIINSNCYYDGSALNAEPIFDLLLTKGHEAVWKKLEEYHKEIFN